MSSSSECGLRMFQSNRKNRGNPYPDHPSTRPAIRLVTLNDIKQSEILKVKSIHSPILMMQFDRYRSNLRAYASSYGTLMDDILKISKRLVRTANPVRPTRSDLDKSNSKREHENLKMQDSIQCFGRSSNQKKSAKFRMEISRKLFRIVFHRDLLVSSGLSVIKFEL